MGEPPVGRRVTLAGADGGDARWMRALRRGAQRGANVYGRIADRLEAYPLERFGLAVVMLGILLRLAVPFFMDLRSDGNTYAAMGHAWSIHRSFLLPYGDVTTWALTPPGYSHHYPPAYPFLLGLVYVVFGFGLVQTKVTAVVISIAAVAAVYATTRDLYGREKAALMAGLIAVEPHLLWVTGTGFSENLVLLCFALTMWAILRGLEDERFIVLAGLFAGVAYLSRSSVGYFFFVAGSAGFVWRFIYQQFRLFTNRWYMGAVVIFGSIVFAWAARNVAHFGFYDSTIYFPWGPTTFHVPNWQTSTYVEYVQEHARVNLGAFGHALVKKFPFFLLFGAWYVLPFLPETFRGVRRIREEHTSALVLSAFLVWILAWMISAMFWTYERTSMYWLDNHRYILIGLLPLGWLILREADLSLSSTRLRYGLLVASLILVGAATVMSPVKFSDLHAAEALDPYLEKGDTLAVGGRTIKYAVYAYLSHPEDIIVYGCTTGPPVCDPSESPEFILSLETGAYDGYMPMGTYNQKFWTGGVMSAKLWAREDIAAARSIPPAR